MMNVCSIVAHFSCIYIYLVRLLFCKTANFSNYILYIFFYTINPVTVFSANQEFFKCHILLNLP